MKRRAFLIAFTCIVGADALALTDFRTGQSAQSVLGQPGFATGIATNPAQANRFNFCNSAAVDPTTGKVFVSDTANNRVLRFSSAAAAQNGSNPEAVFGQPSFGSSSDNQGQVSPSATTMSQPTGIFVDALGRLWVAEFSNHRVLGFYAASSRGDDPVADIVLGQPGFTTNFADDPMTRFRFPTGVIVDANDTLWVADSGNHRVLRFDHVTALASGSLPNGVLGQDNFANNASGLSARKLRTPIALAAGAGGVLWVLDQGNNRALRFDTAAGKSNGDPADRVVGQPNFVTVISTTPVTSRTLLNASGITVDGRGFLWIADSGHNRVLRYATAATLGNNPEPGLVLGQSSLTATAAGTSATALKSPAGVAPGPAGTLLVADTSNSRILRYAPVTTSPRVRIAGRKKFATSHTRLLIRGSSTDATSVRARVGGGKFREARGVDRWKFTARLKHGRNTIQARAFDESGAASPVVRLVVDRR